MSGETVTYVEVLAGPEVITVEAGPQGPEGPQGPPGPYGPKQRITSGLDVIHAASYAVFFQLGGLDGPLIFNLPAVPEDRPYLFKDLDRSADTVPITLTDPTAEFEQPDGTVASTLTLELAGAWVWLWKVDDLWSIVAQ